MSSFPQKVYIDISSFCNHKCNFCSNSDKRTVKKIMSFIRFKRILDNILNHSNIESLGLYSKGEPLLNREITQIIKYSKACGIKYIFITTNGSLLTKNLAVDLFKSGLDSIKLSINALDKENYIYIHKKDHFDRVINNIINLINLKRNNIFDFKFLISVINKNIKRSEVESFFKALLNNNYELIDLIITGKPGYTQKNNIEYYNEEVFKNLCPRPFDEINVTSGGNLNLCCLDFFEKFNFGSLESIALNEAWFSSEFDNIRLMHTNGTLDKDHLCYQCLRTRGDIKTRLTSIEDIISNI